MGTFERWENQYPTISPSNSLVWRSKLLDSDEFSEIKNFRVTKVRVMKLLFYSHVFWRRTLFNSLFNVIFSWVTCFGLCWLFWNMLHHRVKVPVFRVKETQELSKNLRAFTFQVYKKKALQKWIEIQKVKVSDVITYSSPEHALKNKALTMKSCSSREL